MDSSVPYLPSVTNLHKILDKMQNAGVPTVFNVDFLKDLGFTSSNDRPTIKLFKYIGLLDASGRPQTAYREFVDHTKAKKVLAQRLRVAFNDLYMSDKAAHTRTVESLKGWFKTKTGEGDAVAKKIATTFRSLAQYADFSDQVAEPHGSAEEGTPQHAPTASETASTVPPLTLPSRAELGLVYRIEIHLPDTQNVETFRAIFRALREELIP